MSKPSFTMGVEEEYLLVDLATRDLAANPPGELLRDCEARLGTRVTAEFMRSQIEVGTRVCANSNEARSELQELRGTVAEVAAQYGLAPIAASTHPFADWSQQSHTDKERYDDLAQALQANARRLLISGMHVHVAVEEEDMRIDLMNQVTYFLPHLLALSTSSPFWDGENTGLMSYRLTIFDALPRTGVPERFDSFGEYERMVARLVDAGVIEDGTKIWWDMRPSARYPTLEMRISDICTSLDDTLTIAALYQCILSMLYRLRTSNQRWRIYPRICVEENRWRAQRYGVTDTMVDFGLGEQVPYDELLAEIMDMVAPDAEALGCGEDVRHAREILARGTSAQNQIRIFDAAIASGATREAALRDVVDWLIAETVRDL
ncbi:MAG: carboxylate-amine ligase [Rhodospirillaceae bacterium]|nr:carboxylate-amine ligase [Rhodospirillaceae bacterium]MBT4044518.1 carboxylate-amine ligase [Rhodospirillaceae bacterium]MBT4688601.1 carboxylate-amine ligase [Rhodospirillaceae bacterium]MBT5079096.1 carboxylate-amine ligase [Rhodospirillaceae bacterium]MBT5526189.1 carboxylate-amine ligase [Rhodospirillaceae bacterium]